MNSLAANRQDVQLDDTAPTFCVLAVEPDAKQAAILEQALDGRISGKLVVVNSTEAALKALVNAIPDLVLVSPLLPPRTEDRFLEHLRVLGVDASHLQLLSIPRFGDDQAPAPKKRTFGSLGLKKVGAARQTGDSVAATFADEVAACLERLADVRNEGNFFAEGGGFATEQDTGVRLEHIERLLERLPMEEPEEPEELDEPGEQAPVETLLTNGPEPEEDAMPTAQELVGTGTDTPRLPRFLTLDQHIAPSLRAVLDEADGCLRMAFLTGGGACAVRALDILLADQGINDTERAHQLRELGKKHPAVAESFLRILLQVMSDPNAVWDISRLTLAIALLKAIAHEIYVLGPERTERATYVLGLLERFNAGMKGGGTAA
ncbi:MAG: hypothetical protein ND807_15900 [Vicinamibacterales bacterium]|nr:hypothetical protein [Vicinamibacterales bacterium]